MTKAERVVDQLLRNGLRLCGGAGQAVPLTFDEAVTHVQAAIGIAEIEAKALSDSALKNGGPVDAFAAKLAHVLEARAKQHAEEACRIRIALNSDPSRTAAAAAAKDQARAEVFLEFAELVRGATR